MCVSAKTLTLATRMKIHGWDYSHQATALCVCGSSLGPARARALLAPGVPGTLSEQPSVSEETLSLIRVSLCKCLQGATHWLSRQHMAPAWKPPQAPVPAPAPPPRPPGFSPSWEHLPFALCAPSALPPLPFLTPNVKIAHVGNIRETNAAAFCLFKLDSKSLCLFGNRLQPAGTGQLFGANVETRALRARQEQSWLCLKAKMEQHNFVILISFTLIEKAKLLHVSPKYANSRNPGHFK